LFTDCVVELNDVLTHWTQFDLGQRDRYWKKTRITNLVTTLISFPKPQNYMINAEIVSQNVCYLANWLGYMTYYDTLCEFIHLQVDHWWNFWIASREKYIKLEATARIWSVFRPEIEEYKTLAYTIQCMWRTTSAFTIKLMHIVLQGNKLKVQLAIQYSLFHSWLMNDIF